MKIICLFIWFVRWGEGCGVFISSAPWPHNQWNLEHLNCHGGKGLFINKIYYRITNKHILFAKPEKMQGSPNGDCRVCPLEMPEELAREYHRVSALPYPRVETRSPSESHSLYAGQSPPPLILMPIILCFWGYLIINHSLTGASTSFSRSPRPNPLTGTMTVMLRTKT